MKYAHLDINNKILGWYDDDIHVIIPTPNIEVSNEQWQTAIAHNHNKVNNDGTTELFDFRTEEEKTIYLQDTFRFQRDSLLNSIVDHYQKPLVWETLTIEQQDKVRAYRQALLDSTNNWILPEELVL